MKTDVRKIGSVDIFTPSGPLVDHDAQIFCQALTARLHSQTGGTRVGVAMQDVPYMDSVALEGFLEAALAMEERGGALKLAGVSPTCREIFELTGLAPKFRFFKDVEDVVKSFLT